MGWGGRSDWWGGDQARVEGQGGGRVGAGQAEVVDRERELALGTWCVQTAGQLASGHTACASTYLWDGSLCTWLW